MPGSTARSRRLQPWVAAAAAISLSTGVAWGQQAPAAAAPPAPAPAENAAPEPQNSALDDALFYQLLIGEMELSAGRAGSAFEVMLDAARRQKDDALFRRAIDIALQGRAASQALGSADLSACAVFASGHPCPMCMAAMRLAGIGSVTYAYSNEDGEPHGLSTAALRAELARPFSEQSMTIRHVPARLDTCPDLYGEWRRRQDARQTG